VTQPDLSNGEIADRLGLFATLLELADTSPFAVRAYVRAAELIRSTPTSVSRLVREGRVRELRGVGPGIEAKLHELVETGEIAELRHLQRQVRPELAAYARLLGIGTARMLAIARDLDLETVPEFREAAASGRLQDVHGIGPATEAQIRAALDAGPRVRRGLTITRSRAQAGSIASALGGEVAGAARRFCELSHELSVVCCSADAAGVLARFAALPTIVTLLERDDRSAVGLTVEGLPIRLVVAQPQVFGTELFRATGSTEYVDALEPLPSASSEQELFARLRLEPCPPELRESPGAVAPAGLVELADVRGDLHCHTTWSDGRATVHEMALAAVAQGGSGCWGSLSTGCWSQTGSLWHCRSAQEGAATERRSIVTPQARTSGYRGHDAERTAAASPRRAG
jgi:DNA polymerase (family 10)